MWRTASPLIKTYISCRSVVWASLLSLSKMSKQNSKCTQILDYIFKKRTTESVKQIKVKKKKTIKDDESSEASREANTHWWRTEVRNETDNQRLTHSDCQHVHHIHNVHAGCSLWFTGASSAIRCVSTDRSILFQSPITTTHDQPRWERNAGRFNSLFPFHGSSLNFGEQQGVYLKYWFCFTHFLVFKVAKHDKFVLKIVFVFSHT